MKPDDSEESGSDTILSRRELLGASATLGTAALASVTPGVGSVSAQSSTEPRIALGSDYTVDDDPNGNGDLVIEHGPSGNRFTYDASAGEWTAGAINANSFSAGEAEITNETLVNAYASTDTSMSANTWTTVQIDTTNKDEISEFDTANYQFTPAETGWYLIQYQVMFLVGADKDNLLTRVHDSTAGSNVAFDQQIASGSSNQTVGQAVMVKLTGGNTHTLDARNTDSSDTASSLVQGGAPTTYLHIRRAFR